LAVVVHAAILSALLATGASIRFRDAAAAIAGVAPVGIRGAVEVLAYVAALLFVNEVFTLPLAFYARLSLERRYGLSTQRTGAWLTDQAKGLGVGLVLGGAGAVVLYAMIRRWPDTWWLPASAVFALVMVGFASLAPVLLLPLFYRVRPLTRDALRLRLLALAERAGARVLGAYEWGLSEKTRKANAALAGLGSTRRILVSDTMLADYSDDEIEVVLAHEIAHHVHGDMWKGLAFESALLAVGFYGASRALAASAARLG
jgi:STE24 endopeptidase